MRPDASPTSQYARAKDLWNACKQYGYVVDAFIPDRKSKDGKRFGFIRFIKVFDVERLVSNLCTIWIGKHNLHANVVRFHRPSLDKNRDDWQRNGENQKKVPVANKFSGFRDESRSYAFIVKRKTNEEMYTEPVLVLDDSCANKQVFSAWLFGKVKEFKTLANVKVVLENEGFTDIELASNDFTLDARSTWVDVEGVPLKAWSEETFKRIATKWGNILLMEDSGDDLFHSKRLCILTTVWTNIFEVFKIMFNGKGYWVRAKEATGWIPDFDDKDAEDSEPEEENLDDDVKENFVDNDMEDQGKNDVSMVLDTGMEEEKSKREDGEIRSDPIDSEDPFNIYPLLNKSKEQNIEKESKSESLVYPPGFTPSNANEEGVSNGNIGLNEVREMDVETQPSGVMTKGGRSSSGRKGDSPAVGSSGGILCVWEKSSFTLINSTISDYFVMVRGKWVSNGKSFLIISVYAPQELSEKRMLWDYLNHVIVSWQGEVIVMGDFNEVRYKNERFGTVFNAQSTDVFNRFISNSNLKEIPLGGCSFTWCHRSASKMSKLNRFLVSESLLSEFPNLPALSLDRYLSDHRPIMLREMSYDYGPIPFRVFHYWFEIDEFKEIVVNSWKDESVVENNPMLKLMYKLKLLKKNIRFWNDKGNMTDDILNTRKNIINEMNELEKMHSMEMAQKAKIKWAIEGDENSKYYHGILNMRRNQLSIRGILKDGSWIDKLNMVKEDQMTLDQKEELEAEISEDEIKRAIWDCGVDKSPGPDGFSFGFFRRYWDIVASDVVAAVKHFFDSGVFPKGCNSSFIALIPKTPDAKLVKDYRPISLIGCLYKIVAKILANRIVLVLSDLVNEVQSAFVTDHQILDGPFILNEIIQWCKHKKKHSFIFKIYFEKAYDSVRWDYLDDILKRFGFGHRWCDWIQECLRSFRGSVLVNRSPTEEFQFFKGLKQGDPLSPFLFILVMESIHLSFKRVVDAGMFNGIALSPSMKLTHMFYADDAIFMGQWSNRNIDILIYMLKWFHRASGLNINLCKSNLMGIAVPDENINAAAARIGYGTLKIPFYYLGAKVGGCVSKIQSWNEIVDKMNLYGLVLSKQFTRGTGKLVEICGGLLEGEVRLKYKFPRMYALEQNKGISVANKLEQESIHFSFRRHPRSEAENGQWVRLLESLQGVMLSPVDDRWSWSLTNSGEFSVASVRKAIDNKYLPTVSSKTIWIKEVPIKINIHAWKVRLNGLPTRWNLSRRGMDIHSISCPICDSAVESSRHVFFDCCVIKDILRKICNWWNVNEMEGDTFEGWASWILNLRLSSKHKRLLEGVCFSLW
nr:RNA-directed DNA polymerase, eukaryota, reverse transcriptase zinc-binding domain protein [Tanacetum cinerariifolium]